MKHMGAIPPGRAGLIILVGVVAAVFARKAVPFLGKVGEEVEKFGRGMREAAERDAERLKAEQAQREAEASVEEPDSDEIVAEFHEDDETTPEPEPEPVAEVEPESAEVASDEPTDEAEPKPDAS
ncbi:MAG: hypothetical protein ACOYON_03675 [Fimbriimonas sp.]